MALLKRLDEASEIALSGISASGGVVSEEREEDSDCTESDENAPEEDPDEFLFTPTAQDPSANDVKITERTAAVIAVHLFIMTS